MQKQAETYVNGLTVVLIGDDERRAAMKRILRGSPNLQMVGEIAELNAFRLLLYIQPDVVLLDAASADINSLRALQLLHTLPEVPQVIVLAATTNPAERYLMLEHGADAYVRLDAPPALLNALYKIAAANPLAQPAHAA